MDARLKRYFGVNLAKINFLFKSSHFNLLEHTQFWETGNFMTGYDFCYKFYRIG